MSVEKSLKFSGQLRVLLYKNDVTQTALADSIGVSKQVISKWLAGQSVPDMISFQRIAKFFNVPYDYLYGDEESKALWDITPEFGVAVAKKIKAKKLTIEDVERRSGLKQSIINHLIKYGKTKKAGSSAFEYRSEFGLRLFDDLCEVLELDIGDYTVLNQHSQAISPYRADEEAIIKAFRDKPEMQEAVKKLLDVKE
ncbi:MAG: helix-turn-helix domain-containing protein [Oscillospiraceae bacterium]|nr:helix-turn-helix domain-containing protein [Oscillospiraceae bacterium]